jgi:hypothetical protein
MSSFVRKLLVLPGLLIAVEACLIYSDDLLEPADDDEPSTTTSTSGGHGGEAGFGGMMGGMTSAGGATTSTSTSSTTSASSTTTSTTSGTGGMMGGTPWINEIHYDNVSTDVNEGFEIAGPTGTDLTGYSVELHSVGVPYGSVPLTGVLSNQQNGYGTKWFSLPTNGLQNGPQDGLALIGPGDVLVQYLSYEGTMVGTTGPTAGVMSVDIGVAEDINTPVDHSLQLSGTGTQYSDFTWVGPALASPDAVNANQSFQ